MRNRISAAVIGIGILGLASLTWVLRSAERPADEPTPKPSGIFSEVGGWIVYGDKDGIWAVDPTRPDDPNSRIQLSTERGRPLAWSSDGSKLLILRPEQDRYRVPRRLFVLNADGTETHLTTSKNYVLGGGWSSPDIGGSFSPDGSQVVFANKSSLYLVDTQGGTPRVLQTGSRRWFSVNGRRVRALPYNPTYSPDGTQIAYFDGAGASGEGIVHQLRVMNADGSGGRVLFESQESLRVYNLAWSPDGERLAFGLDKGIYIVGADGSGLTLAIPDGAYPYWSPDGTRIAYIAGPRDGWVVTSIADWLGTLEIAAVDGTHVQEFGYAKPGPWNPLVQPEPEAAEVPATSEGLTLTSPLLLGVASLAEAIGDTEPSTRRGAARAVAGCLVLLLMSACTMTAIPSPTTSSRRWPTSKLRTIGVGPQPARRHRRLLGGHSIEESTIHVRKEVDPLAPGSRDQFIELTPAVELGLGKHHRRLHRLLRKFADYEGHKKHLIHGLLLERRDDMRMLRVHGRDDRLARTD